MTKEELIAFEKDIEQRFLDRQIRAPIHLSDGNEDQLISVFAMIKPTDWIFTSWRNHYHALLHGIDPEWLREEIIKGHSMSICSWEHKFFTSAIVGGNSPPAVGAALAMKRSGSADHVWNFVGDMTAETGVFHECVKYAENHDLPITFVIEDNGFSVGAPTRPIWGYKDTEVVSTMPSKISDKVWKYSYVKNVYPHVGCGQWVSF